MSSLILSHTQSVKICRLTPILPLKIIEQLWTMGAYDVVALFEAHDDETMTAFACKVSSLGNVKTQTMRAFRKEEMEGILAKIK